MKKNVNTSKDCEKCGVHLMNKEERFCTACHKEHVRGIHTKLIIFAIVAAVGGSGLVYLAEYFELSGIWKFAILAGVMVIVPVTMNKIRKA